MANNDLERAISTLMDKYGETGVLRACAEEIDRRLVRALHSEQRLKKILEEGAPSKP